MYLMFPLFVCTALACKLCEWRLHAALKYNSSIIQFAYICIYEDLQPCFSRAGMSSLMSSSFAAVSPFCGQPYAPLTASAK
jgi:hypothetical protein